uniref:Uncharacterized protein n=1 Tax=viral metagenome TaxID=1070528 RepID=A0A6C0HMI9_9ZZZZ
MTTILGIKLSTIISTCVAILYIGGLLYILVLSMNSTDNNESWVNYEVKPFGFQSAGSGNAGVRPIAFYDVPRYRRPYNWPACHLVDYPYEHCEPNE